MSDEKNQTLIEHLIELRTRVMRALAAVLIIFLAMVAFANPIYEAISDPLRDMMPEGSNMIATEVASPFLAPLKLAAMLSVFAAMPVILFQLWAFIAPGLYKREKAVAIPIFVSSVVLFYLGMVFAYFVVFPLIFGFFTSVGPSSVAVMTDINAYLNFVLKLFFAFGVAFEIPVATFVLIRAGLVSRESLAAKRAFVLVGCFIFGMLLTPPDMFSQALLAIPMYALFELGLLFSKSVPRMDDDDEPEDQPEEDNN